MEANGGGVSSLPEDVIFAVLSWLPAKPLCRFRCVSKAWRALISDPAFVAAQKSRAAPVIAGMFRSGCPDQQKFELRVMDMDGNVLRVFKDVARILLPTRLDLICVYKMHGGATIIDPAAGRVSTVGEHNPMASLCHYSFGRAAPSGAYKLLRFHERLHGLGYFCEIATINDFGKEPTWRQRPVPPFITDGYRGRKATINGVLYFMPQTTGDAPKRWIDGNRIANFNLENEEWTETINGPDMGQWEKGESWTIALTELKATLSMVQTVHTLADRNRYFTNIWVLIDSKRSIWVKQYTIQMPRSLFFTKVLDVRGDGKVLLLNGSDKREKNRFSHRYVLQLYNLSTEDFTEIMEMAEEFDGAMAFYTGSLLS
ncbi:unnamed protein product [Urochloa humidicola]